MVTAETVDSIAAARNVAVTVVLAELGLTPTAYYRWKNEGKPPPALLLERLAKLTREGLDAPVLDAPAPPVTSRPPGRGHLSLVASRENESPAPRLGDTALCDVVFVPFPRQGFEDLAPALRALGGLGVYYPNSKRGRSP